MSKKIKKYFGKLLCKLGFHDMEWLDFENRGIAGGCRCRRENCDFKIDPIE
jgi:hypothetical protein